MMSLSLLLKQCSAEAFGASRMLPSCTPKGKYQTSAAVTEVDLPKICPSCIHIKGAMHGASEQF